jgi:predicted RecB family nuclease
MSAPAEIRLSKSKFVAGLQCLKRLYLQVHQPELAGEVDEEQEAIFAQGNETGVLAQSAFPGGVAVDAAGGLDDAMARTAALVQDHSVPAIFEATFIHAGVLVRVDILQRRPRNRWRLIEVKSSLDYKEQYLYDVAIQHHVLAGCGLDISAASLMHLNRDYVYDGQQHDVHALFTSKDLTRRVRKLGSDVSKLLKKQWKVLAQDGPPDIAAGDQCSEPYVCEFFGHCNPAVPDNHISFLPRLREKKRQDLLDLDISLIGQIPEDFPLSEVQRRILNAVKTDSPYISETLAKELSRLKYPRYFMDFESRWPAIPRYAGMRPYSHIPFQWSVHRQASSDADLEHFEFLADDAGDPRGEFTRTLCEALGRRGPIVVYNAGFEAQRLGELAKRLPGCKGQIAGIQERLWDLLAIVRKHVYHPKFCGSFALKDVLPALAPGFTYEGMEVAHGGQAGLAWDRMLRGSVDAEERRRLKSALLQYCRQDTLAMVMILQRLRSLSSNRLVAGA